MPYHLVCVTPFHGYAKGQKVTDQNEIAKLSSDRDHHFVRIAVPNVEEAAPVAETEEAHPVSE